MLLRLLMKHSEPEPCEMQNRKLAVVIIIVT